MLKYHITYISILILGAMFFFMGIIGHIPHLPCITKYFTGLSCPSCGITRSVILALHGNIASSFSVHPFGLFVIASTATVMTLSAYGLIKRSRLKWLFGKNLTIIAVALVIIYLLVWLFRIVR